MKINMLRENISIAFCDNKSTSLKFEGPTSQRATNLDFPKCLSWEGCSTARFGNWLSFGETPGDTKL